MPDQGTEEHLNTLVGEGKKYADTENLAKGYVNLEAHVETIKQEKAELEEKLNIKGNEQDHLETIVSLLKTPDPTPEPEPDPEPDPQPEPDPEPAKEPKEVPVSVQLNMQQFAKDSVAKYGNADAVGKHLKEYINGDEGRQALVTSMMQTDPSALIKILPDKDTVFNPTGSGGTPQSDSASLPLTWEDCIKVRKEDPTLFSSPKFIKKMMDARKLAKQKGIPFGSA